MTAVAHTTAEAKEVYPDDMKTIGGTWSIDDDDVATVVDCDDIVVEDLPSDYDSEAQVHDQLPSVEEAKLSLGQNQPSCIRTKINRHKKCLIVTGLIALATILGISIAAASTNNNKSANTYEPNDRFEDVVMFLFNNQISSLPSLEDKQSAEHRAALFIADGDTYQSEMTEANIHKFVERYILALFYYQFNGPEWDNNYHFLSGQDHCTWTMTVTRPAGTFVKGVTCNEDGYVTGLDLCECIRETIILRGTIFSYTR
jgi:hypothetical protein